MAGFEYKKAVIYIERWGEFKEISFGAGILTDKSAFGGTQVAILIFREVREMYRTGAELNGVQKSLDYEKEENRWHIVTLVHARGVVDFSVFLSHFYLNLAIFIEFFDSLDKGRRQAIFE